MASLICLLFTAQRAFDMVQAQCHKDLKVLSKQIESKQSDLDRAQQELQHQQKREAAVQKQISEAERRLQVDAKTLVQQSHKQRVSTAVTWQQRCYGE